MNNQYCRIGAVKPITSGNSAIAILEHRYHRFLEKATNPSGIDARLGDFFDAKVKSLKKALESLV
ncbi:hypothetical protein L0P88_16420 [Muricauda sp. SCSIO 64092]|uniref:hypothetical protein n=1 Tax=Allomuricauda sp. SCSIO 64092 TaxID=2908842 RepID=UPI001FF67DCE|nr:hypothetical protein [Muricauda sp. SCSIO 64092]UOY05527.1 hypothetical protein L0P88_16420 [Muricauda sp. SCSIO 64092]